MTIPRGIRNNNPMNIRISSVAWRHKDVPSKDSDFETFPTPEDGLHAGLKNVLNSQLLHGCKSINAIISRLSPPNENATSEYVDHCCDKCGTQPDEHYDLTVNSNLYDLGVAIIFEENGVQPYSADMINKEIKGILP